MTLQITSLTRYGSHQLAAAALSMDAEQFTQGSTVIGLTWLLDGDTIEGFYEALPDGKFLCTVFNESELFEAEMFDAESACQAWLMDRLN